MQVGSLGQEDPPEKEMATHSSILAWRIPRILWGSMKSDMTEETDHIQRLAHKSLQQFCL